MSIKCKKLVRNGIKMYTKLNSMFVSKYNIESVYQKYSIVNFCEAEPILYTKYNVICVNAICFLLFYQDLYAYMYKP